MGIQSFLVLRLSRRRVRGRLSAIILSCLLLQIFPTGVLTDETATDLPSECRLSPHYRTKSPLDELLRRVQPQLDAFPTEALADEVEKLLEKWQKALQKCVDLAQRYEEPVPEPIAPLHDMLCAALAMVERGENPLPHLQAFAASVVSETWFTLI